MFNGLLVVLCITHAYIMFIVGIDSVEGRANGPWNKIQQVNDIVMFGT